MDEFTAGVYMVVIVFVALLLAYAGMQAKK